MNLRTYHGILNNQPVVDKNGRTVCCHCGNTKVACYRYSPMSRWRYALGPCAQCDPKGYVAVAKILGRSTDFSPEYRAEAPLWSEILPPARAIILQTVNTTPGWVVFTPTERPAPPEVQS